MMLACNIVTQDYQNYFMWREREVKRLIVQSFNNGLAVQPVSISLYSDSTNMQNYIFICNVS